MKWTQEEIEKLRELYPEASKEEIEKAIPNHTWVAIIIRGTTLEIKRRHGRHIWTLKEDEFLRINANKLNVGQLSYKLNKGYMATWARLQTLGINYESKQGIKQKKYPLCPRCGSKNVKSHGICWTCNDCRRDWKKTPSSLRGMSFNFSFNPHDYDKYSIKCKTQVI